MAAYAGTTLSLLFVDDGNAALGGIRNLSWKASAGIVDVTNKDSASGWRELLGGCGRVNATISGQLVFTEDAMQSQMVSNFNDRGLKRYRFRISPGGFTLIANCRITEFELAGEYEDAVMYNFTMETAEIVTYADLT